MQAVLPGLELARSVPALVEPRHELARCDVPDALWPSGNEWDVPDLSLQWQADAVHLPIMLWGAVKRKTQMRGTWLFYTDDYRFKALWKDPSPVVNTGCVAVVEPNFTIGPQTPQAVALWHIYRKRWIARWWQTYGLRVFVDVNVDVEWFGDIMLLGVPRGWRAYATRGYTSRMAKTVGEYKLACDHAGTDDVLFLVYGGGKAVKLLAKQRGWIWVPEHMDVKRGGNVLDMRSLWDG